MESLSEKYGHEKYILNTSRTTTLLIHLKQNLILFLVFIPLAMVLKWSFFFFFFYIYKIGI